MTQFDALDSLVRSGNGYLQTAEVTRQGISKPTLAEYVSRRQMQRVAHGLYLSPDAWQDDLFQLSAANGKAVFSHETALLLLGLTERVPEQLCVTVPAGYNATHLRRQGVKVYQVKPELARLGETETRTVFGNPVRVFDRERTICDIIRQKDSMDIQMFRFALKTYMADRQKDLNRLMAYAETLGIEKAVRMYTEVML